MKHAPNKYVRAGQTELYTKFYNGVYKGIVEFDRDPFSLGRLKVRIYQIHGTYAQTSTQYLPWSSPIFPNLFHYHIPKVGDRVWVLFEMGHRDFPMWFGHWPAIPVGRQGDIYENRLGSEVPREVWDQTFLKEEGTSSFRTHAGNQLFALDHDFFGTFNSQLCLQDSGGKYIKLISDLNGGAFDSGDTDANGAFFPHRVKDLSSTDDLKVIGGLELSTHYYSFRNKITDAKTSYTKEIHTRKGLGELWHTGGATDDLRTHITSYKGQDYNIRSIKGPTVNSLFTVNEDHITFKPKEYVIIRSDERRSPEVW